MDQQGPSKYKNIFSSSNAKPLYSNLKVDATAPTKLKCNARLFAVPYANGVGVYHVPKGTNQETIRIETAAPICLVHNKQISDYEFSPLEPTILATTTRADGLIRIWKIPEHLAIPSHAPPRKSVTDSSGKGDDVKEIDAASIYLAGHEKKINAIKFHPTVGNILSSASVDSTVRLWEVEAMQDRITLTCPKDENVQSLSFDYCGDKLACASTDASLHIYDIRANNLPAQTANTEYSAAKAIRTCWLTPDPLVLTTGFRKEGIRDMSVWDLRNLSKAAQSLIVQGTGVTILQPTWDQSLPLVYLTSKGEGVRVYELLNGVLNTIGTMKVERQATAMDLLPKSLCSSTKCEISRFLHLGVDNAVDMTSIFVPRVNGETAFQKDLYPPLTLVDPEATADRYFNKKESVEPLMVDFVDMGAPPPESEEESASSLQVPALPVLFGNRNRSKSLPRSTSMTRRMSSLSRDVSIRSLDAEANGGIVGSSSTDNVAALNSNQYHDGGVDLERRGWFGSYWEPHYLSLKKSKLYVSTHQDAESPLFYITLGTVKRIEPFAVGRAVPEDPNANQLGFLIETPEITYRFKAATYADRQNWVTTLQNHKTMSSGLAVAQPESANGSNTNSPHPIQKTSTVRRVVGNRDGAALIGEVTYLGNFEYTSPKAHPVWTKQIVVLDEEGLIHIYSGDIKEFTQGKPPLESLNLGSVISVRLTDSSRGVEGQNGGQSSNKPEIHSGLSGFQVNTSRRAMYFQCRSPYEAANWVLQIRRVVHSKSFIPAADLVSQDVLEGPVDVKAGLGPTTTGGGVPAGKYWLSIIDGTFYYFRGRFSTSPSHVIEATVVEQVRIPEDQELDAEKLANTSAKSKGNQSTHQASFNSKDLPALVVCLRGNNRCMHVLETMHERELWLKELSRIWMNAFDLLGKLGFTTDQMLNEAMAKTKADFWEDVPKVEFIHDKQVEKGEQKVLIGIYGKTRLTIRMVPLSWKALCVDASFVLDAGSSIYHWNGTKSSRLCRATAMGVAGRIRKERGTRPKVFLVEPDDYDLTSKLFKLLGLPDSTTKTELQIIQDKLPSSEFAESDDNPHQLRIFKVGSSLIRRRRVQFMYEGLCPSKQCLESPSVYLVQCPPHEVFVWIGKSATNEFRCMGMLLAKQLSQQMAADQPDLDLILVQKVNEGHESAVFKEKFVDYEGSLPISMRPMELAKGNIVTGIKQEPIDIGKLLIPEVHEQTLVDNGRSGNLTIYRVKDFTREVIDQNLVGQFFRGESYILMYTYKPALSGVERCISYFWQGMHSTITEKGTSALMTIELSEKTGGDVVQVRVVEGKEPKHMCLLFGEQQIVIRLGMSTDPATPRKYTTFDIREYYDGLCKAIECDVQELPFHTNHVSVMIGQQKAYKWHGRHASESEKQYADQIIKRFSKLPATPVPEGQESSWPEFSELFQKNRDKDHELRKDAAKFKSRLFVASSGSGMVKVHEIVHFTQDDLDPNVVMILDAGENIYVWFGTTSKTNEKMIAMETFVKYVEQSKLHNKTQTALWVTYAYQEPSDFTQHFHGFTKTKFPKDKTGLPVRKRPLNDVLKEYTKKTYSVDVLLSDRLPENVDPTKLEMYLSEEDFENIFKMKREDFMAMKPWKREEVKKTVGFF
ncbi:Coronin-2B [Quaeritorhiza haematococci]|nr:Coronin-2B [Quaeritorhiza haematococci]